MDETAKRNGARYLRWLVCISLIGGTAGWVVQGLLSTGFVFWALPLFWIGTLAATVNGDAVVEALVVCAIAAVPAFFLSRCDWIMAWVGCGTIPGAYAAFALAKVTFGLAKEFLHFH